MTPLLSAVEKGHVDVVSSLLVAGAGVQRINANGLSALHLCVGIDVCRRWGCGVFCSARVVVVKAV